MRPAFAIPPYTRNVEKLVGMRCQVPRESNPERFWWVNITEVKYVSPNTVLVRAKGSARAGRERWHELRFCRFRNEKTDEPEPVVEAVTQARNRLYSGFRGVSGITEVRCNGDLLDPRHDLANHSPDGFEWGYEGSGPAQLALALLAHYLQDDQAALKLFQQFKRAVVSHLPKESWQLTSFEIEGFLTTLKKSATP